MTPPKSPLPLALLLIAACGKRPCEPWQSNGLAELATAPGERIEHCDAGLLRWRVVPGGAAEAWLAVAARREYSGWKLWNREAWVRKGDTAMRVRVLEAGDDLVIELSPDPSIDVAAALGALADPQR